MSDRADGEPLPQVGGLSIILDGAGLPLCLIETVEVTINPLQPHAARHRPPVRRDHAAGL